MDLSRRSLLRGLFAMPAVVAVQNIMPVRLWVPPKPPKIIVPEVILQASDDGVTWFDLAEARGPGPLGGVISFGPAKRTMNCREWRVVTRSDESSDGDWLIRGSEQDLDNANICTGQELRVTLSGS